MTEEGGSGALIPDPTEREDIRAWWAVYERHRDEMQARLDAAARGIPDFERALQGLTAERARAQAEESYERQSRAVLHDEWEPLVFRLREDGARYALGGVSLVAWYRLTSAYRDVALDFIAADLGADPPRMLGAMRGLGRYLDVLLAAIGEGYLEMKQRLIEQQEGAIRELSTPVLRLLDRFLVVPVVGVVNGDRARQLTESLLRAIREHRARVVVMDITGVPIVDSRVANNIVQTVEAARLMGSEVIVTGISPDIAQTLVGLGETLGSVHTLGDLQQGFELAARRLGLSLARGPVVPKPEEDGAAEAPRSAGRS